MFTDMFQLSAIPSDHLTGSYDIRLVLLSFMVAMSASYIALDLTGRLRDLSNTRTSSLLWLISGSIAMGAGIWSMHFIGMLSFSIPGLTLRYDLLWTAISLIVAIVASGFALYLLQASVVRTEHYIAGGVILGIAIASMHYTGMEGLLISLNIRYLPNIFFLSILVALVASEAAIWLAIKSNQVTLRTRSRIKLVSSIIMGFAICGMHYTGMAASVFTPLCAPSIVADSANINPAYLSVVIASVTFVILAIAFLASSYKESLNQQQFEKARQLGMAEISASVLHNVGNVLNSVNVSANMVSERINASKLEGLQKLAALLNENKHDLVSFFQNGQGLKAIEFLNVLSSYWQEEQKTLSEEMLRLNHNIDLIKKIISTQQQLSKTNEFEQIISINELLDEALLIAGIYLQKSITIEKNYDKIAPIRLDKVKLLQVFVNLVQNAKDAVLESTNTTKSIIITTAVVKGNITIQITDTGIGILPKNLSKIFTYGFTTKESGHGFGLHTSAIAINALGGRMHATSDGYGKGSTFIIDIPIKKAR